MKIFPPLETAPIYFFSCPIKPPTPMYILWETHTRGKKELVSSSYYSSSSSLKLFASQSNPRSLESLLLLLPRIGNSLRIHRNSLNYLKPPEMHTCTQNKTKKILLALSPSLSLLLLPPLPSHDPHNHPWKDIIPVKPE